MINTSFTLRFLRSVTAFAIFLGLTWTASAQQHHWEEVVANSPDKPFQELTAEIENWYSDKNKGKGSGYFDFKRWEADMVYYLNEDGSIPDFKPMIWDAYLDFQSNSRKGKRTSGTEPWEELGPNDYTTFGQGYSGGVGRIDEIAVDPADANIYYAGSQGGGLWKSTDAGLTWTNITEGFTFISYLDGLAIDPFSDPNNRTLYILVDDIGLLKSVDGGTTWNSTGFLGEANGIVMHPTDTNVLFIYSKSTSSRGIHRSTDGGLTWTHLDNSNTVIYLLFKPDDPMIVYASTSSSRFLRSTDGGLTYTQIDDGLDDVLGGKYHIAVTPANPDYVYLQSNLVDYNGALHAGFYRSEDGGLTFQRRTVLVNNDDPDLTINEKTIAVSSTNPDIIHCGHIDAYRSLDGGESWEQSSWWVETSGQAQNGRYTHADIRNVKDIDGVVYLGTDGGFFTSTDDAWTYTDHSSGLRTAQIYRHSSDQNNADNVFYGSQDNGTMRLTNDVANQFFGADGMVVHVSPEFSELIYYEYQFGGLRKTDNGGTNGYDIVPPGSATGNWITPFDLQPESSFTLAAGYEDVYHSSDGGDSWDKISDNLIPPAENCGVLDYAGPNTIYVAKSAFGRLYRGDRNGGTWTWTSIYAGLPVGRLITDIISDEDDPNRVWVTLNGLQVDQKVFLSEDGGATWTNLSTGLPNVSMQCIVYDQETDSSIYVGTDIGVFHYDPDTAMWIACDNGLPVVRVRDIDIQYSERKLRVSTYGRGVWESELEEIEEVINTNLEEPLIGEFSGPMQGLLVPINPIGSTDLTAYPNPFSNQAVLEFSIEQEATVNLAVYDLKGTLVKTLISEQKRGAGSYRTSVNRQGLIPGNLYLVSLQTNGQPASSAKIILTE